MLKLSFRTRQFLPPIIMKDRLDKIYKYKTFEQNIYMLCRKDSFTSLGLYFKNWGLHWEANVFSKMSILTKGRDATSKNTLKM